MKASVLLGLTLGLALSLTSCDKKTIQKEEDGMISELARMGQLVSVNQSNYTRVEATPLQQTQPNAPYSGGVIEYVEDGEVTAIVDFSAGGIGQAKVTDKDGESTKDLEKVGGKDDDYTKVITEPLVQSEDCEYIVAGEVKFYKGDKWVATFDYGDGECDDLVVKTTKDGETGFSLADYPEYN